MKKKAEEKRPPAPAQRDERFKKPSTGAEKPGKARAPDGISGDWN